MRGTGRSAEIRAGTYSLTTGMTLDDAVEVLTTPPKQVPTAEVLIPPGYRLTQIAEAVEDALGIPAERVPRPRREGPVRSAGRRCPSDASARGVPLAGDLPHPRSVTTPTP